MGGMGGGAGGVGWTRQVDCVPASPAAPHNTVTALIRTGLALGLMRKRKWGCGGLLTGGLTVNQPARPAPAAQRPVGRSHYAGFEVLLAAQGKPGDLKSCLR